MAGNPGPVRRWTVTWASTLARATSALVACALVAAVLVVSGGVHPPAAGATGCDNRALLRDPVLASRVGAAAQRDFLERMNRLRFTRGLPGAVWNEAMAGPAADWSRTMASQIPPGGTTPGWLHHARDTGPNDGVEPWQDYVTINSRLVPNWTRLAENVGKNSLAQVCDAGALHAAVMHSAARLQQAFEASPGHLTNMLSHDQLGLGVHIDGSHLWVTIRYAVGDHPHVHAVPPNWSEWGYVDAVHHLFLGRGAQPHEARYWSGPVQYGRLKDMTVALATTNEWAGVRIDDLYRTVLGRGADAGGRAFWVGQVAAGMRLEGVAAHFYGSTEYYRRAGGNPEGFVNALYRDILERNADSGGRDHWAGRMHRGELDAAGVAASFYASVESRRDRVLTLFVEVLGRKPDAAGWEYWTDRLLHLGDVVLAAELASSAEYRLRST